MAAETTILVVDESQLVLDGVLHLVPAGVVYTTARSVAEALARIAASDRLHGLAVDCRLGDGGCETVLRAWKLAYPERPMFVMTSYADLELIRLWLHLRFGLLPKPFGAAEFHLFTDEVSRARWPVPRAVEGKFMAFKERQQLTEPQTELFAKYASNVPRHRMAEELGIAASTLKTRVSQLCAKLVVGNLDQAYDLMMREGAEGRKRRLLRRGGRGR